MGSQPVSIREFSQAIVMLTRMCDPQGRAGLRSGNGYDCPQEEERRRMEQHGTSSSGGGLSFLRENGVYVFLSTFARRPSLIVRNRMLAAHFRIKQIDIGPRAYLRGLSHIDMGEDFSAG